jgi:phosphate:Na+ symporter
MTYIEFFILLGGVGLFLYGMTIMSTGLRSACGDSLQGILEGATKNSFRAILVGIGITVLVQSSSATDVMVIGFVNSGMMSLTQAIGVIMGANIGTTVTAQITAFNISAYAPLMIFLGAIAYMFVKKQMVKYVGQIILGFGMLFEGIALMKSAIIPLSETDTFKDAISSISNPLLLVLFGVAFTAVLQSSSSATVIFQAFAMQGMLTYESCVYLVIGSAIGSVTPNLLASLTTNRNGKRTAILNLLFNIIRAVLVCLVINIFPYVLTFIQGLSPDNVARQIANTHTIFAIFAVLVIAPFSKFIVKLAEKIIPIQEDEMRGEEKNLLYLANVSKIPPSMAVIQAKKEVVRMGNLALDNFRASLECLFNMDDEQAEKVFEMEDIVNYLDKSIITKLVELRSGDLPEKDTGVLYYIILAIDDIERISDFARDIAEYQVSMSKDKLEFSEEAIGELMTMANRVIESVELCLDIFETEDFFRIPKAVRLENEIDQMQLELMESHVERLMNDECNPVKSVIFSDIVTILERTSDHALKIGIAMKKARENS